MTIETTANRISYTGSGTTGPFSFPYYFLADGDLTVIKTTIADGTESTLTLTTDYTVSGAGEAAGGSVTLVATLSSAYKLTIIRDPDILQPADYPANDRFPAATHEEALDRATMILQRLKDLIDRSFRLSDGDVSGISLILSNLGAGKLIAVNSAGTGIESIAAADVDLATVTSYIQTLLDDADAATARATLGAAATGANTFTGLQQLDYSTDIASAATVDLGTATGNSVTVTHSSGTTAITSFGGAATAQKGTIVAVIPSISGGTLTVTHHATNMILLGGANITLASGDVLLMMKNHDSNAEWKHVGGSKADGTAWVASSGGRKAPNFANNSAQVAQRTTAGTLSTSRVVGQCDNIAVWASGGSVSAGTITQISTATAGTTGYACRAAGVTLTGSGQISHAIRMESLDAKKYKNQTASISVKVDHDVGSAIDYTLVVKKANAADNFTAMTTISTSGTTSVSSGAGTTVNFNGVSMGDCSNGIELEVQAACGAVTTKNFNCTEFNIDIAATATTYVAPDYEDELLRCQRYLPVWKASSANSELVGMGQCYSTTQAIIEYKYPTRPRIPPTGLTASSAGHFNVTTNTAGASNCSGFAFNTAGNFSCSVTATVASGLVAGNATFAFSNNASAEMVFTGAELF